MREHQFLAALVSAGGIRMLLLMVKKTITTNINWAFSMFQARCQTLCMGYVIQSSHDPLR